MANRNTKWARQNGYSDIKRMQNDNPKSPNNKNYGVRTGVTVDSQLLREKSGKSPADPRGSDHHWTQPDHGRSVTRCQ